MYTFKFKRPLRRQQSLVGRCLLRMLWANIFSPKTPLEIIPNENGAPLLSSKGISNAWGSISHSHNMVCATLSTKGPVGIDVEKLDLDRNISRHVAYMGLPQPNSALDAYKEWTKLEALSKAYGLGLDHDISNDISFKETLHQSPQSFHHYEIKDYLICVHITQGCDTIF